MILKNSSVDCVILDFKKNKLNVLLWQAVPELLSEFFNTMEKQEDVAHHAACLSSFNMNIYNKLVEEGLNFRI